MFQHHCRFLYVPALTAWLVKKCQFGEVSNLLTWLRILSIFVAFSSSQTEASLTEAKYAPLVLIFYVAILVVF